MRTEETYNSLLSLPSDFYDLIILEDIRYEKGLLPILDHFSLLGGEDKVLDLYPLYQLLANEETHFETHLCFLKQRKHGERGLGGESIQGAFEIQLGGFDEFERLQQKILDNPGGR